jgi:Zn-dependent peptidase ImmA (M78 family)/transcriptional regulator with XRE-family HTH domain
MSARTEALIKPALLVWARKSAGLDPAAVSAKLKVPLDKFKKWETGEARPSIAQLRKLAEVYKRPLAVFYLADPPEDFQALRDFRRLPERLLGSESYELRLEVRKAQYRREAALDIYAALGEKPPEFTARTSAKSRPDPLAQSVRERLGISLGTQFAWYTEYDAFNVWRRAIERLGVMIFQASKVDVEEMRGFSLALTPLPVIVLNIKDPVRARIFTLLHEFTHLMLREGGICDLDETPRHKSPGQEPEVYANMVAGAVLVPRDALLREVQLRSSPGSDERSEDDIEYLSKRFRVSREVIVRRLLVAGLATEEFYREKRAEYAKQFKATTRTTGFAPPYALALSRAGDSFSRLVLAGYASEKLTSSDVSDLLEVRLKHLPRIEQSLLHSSAVPAGA